MTRLYGELRPKLWLELGDLYGSPLEDQCRDTKVGRTDVRDVDLISSCSWITAAAKKKDKKV